MSSPRPSQEGIAPMEVAASSSKSPRDGITTSSGSTSVAVDRKHDFAPTTKVLPSTVTFGFLSQSWTPLEEVQSDKSLSIPMLLSALANGLPGLFPRAAAITLFVIFQVVMLIYTVLMFVPVGSGAGGIPGLARRSAQAFAHNPFTPTWHMPMFFAGHLVLAVTFLVGVGADWSSNGIYDAFGVYYYEREGLVLFPYIVLALSMFYAVNFLTFMVSWRPRERASAAQRPRATNLVVLDGIDWRSRPYSGSQKGAIGLLLVVGVLFALSPLIKFAYDFPFDGRVPASMWTVSALGSIVTFGAVLLVVATGRNIVTLLRHCGQLSRSMSHEPLTLPDVSPASLCAWWVRRSEFVHRTLPTVYLQVAWFVSVVTMGVLVSTVFVVVTVLTRGMNSIWQYDVLVNCFVAVFLGVAVVTLLDREVAIFVNGQHLRHVLSFISMNVRCDQHVGGDSKLPINLPADTNHEEVIAIIETITQLTESDPFASVFGIPVKPTFRNVIVGYMVTAFAAVISQGVFGKKE